VKRSLGCRTGVGRRAANAGQSSPSPPQHAYIDQPTPSAMRRWISTAEVTAAGDLEGL